LVPRNGLRIIWIHPFVTASAESADWIWTIPLYSKLSSGYVYASSFLAPSDAEDELRRFIEPLESTGLAITQMGVEMLASMLDARYVAPDIVTRYNAYLDKFIKP
jgi:hypothetical protein